MAITYPIRPPNTIGIAQIELRAVTADAVTESPFTFDQQVIKHMGERWEATITIPPCKRDLAEPWVAFLLSLKGRTGTFLLGDPNCKTARGTASVTPGTPEVNGGSQTGGTISIDGMPTNETGYLLAGDYIQIGGGSASKLYKVLQDVDTDGLGAADIEIWPNVNTAFADNTTVLVSSTEALFRLKSPITSWSINNINSYGIQFECYSI